MSRRVWGWVLTLLTADAVAFALTVHSQLDYHAGPSGPSVTTLGQVLGWIVSVGLLGAAVLTVLGARQAARYRLDQVSGQRVDDRVVTAAEADVQGDRHTRQRRPTAPERGETIDGQAGEDGDRDQVDDPEDGDVPVAREDR